MALHPSNGDGKNYRASDFRGNFPSNTAYSGDVRRHTFNCELAAAAASYAPCATYSESTKLGIRQTLSSASNVTYYGSSSANSADRVAANMVLQSAHTGERVVLTPHQAAHIRNGAAVIAAHKDDLPKSFVQSASALYANVYDQSGHKVVDRRSLRTD